MATKRIWPWNCFNSLFIGIGSAIDEPGYFYHATTKGFNSLFIGIGSAIFLFRTVLVLVYVLFQFPFHRDRLCNINISLFDRQNLESFNSLFIGIGSAIFSKAQTSFLWILRSFNSLFIGIGSAITCVLKGIVAQFDVSIPFSSG